jgi:hypothetical protein
MGNFHGVCTDFKRSENLSFRYSYKRGRDNLGGVAALAVKYFYMYFHSNRMKIYKDGNFQNKRMIMVIMRFRGG